MIQRIQSFYLLIVALISVLIPFCLDSKLLFWFLTSSLLAFLSFFSFKKRQNQFVLNRINIVCNLLLIVFFISANYKLINNNQIVFESNFTKLIPAIAIIFLVLANKSIKKDDDLVKSADRLR